MFVLPSLTLLKIAQAMPETTNDLVVSSCVLLLQLQQPFPSDIAYFVICCAASLQSLALRGAPIC